MASIHENNKLDPSKEVFVFDGKMKKISLLFIFFGFVGVSISLIGENSTNHYSRLWSNLLLNTYYFNGIALCSVFFLAAHSIGYGGWINLLKRVFDSIGYFVFVTFIFFSLIILGMWFDWHGLYHHWTHAAADDTIVADKKAFLNKETITILWVVFSVLWMLLVVKIRKHSLAEDNTDNILQHNQKTKYLSAAFITVFGVSTSVFSWMVIMSLDPHWYSTMFGWYNFSSYMCGFLSISIIIITYLKNKGHLVNVNENHIFNLSLFLFGFSVFYTYLWFDQFMLIWYGNIPEDTMYYVKRFEQPLFNVLFFIVFIVNFVFPFLFFIKRKAKRNLLLMNIAAVILFVGHYFDYYIMVMLEPNTVSHETEHKSKSTHLANNTKLEHLSDSLNTENVTSDIVPISNLNTHKTNTNIHFKNPIDGQAPKRIAPKNIATIGLVELFIFLGFLGLFFYTVLSVLSRNRIVPIRNPFIDESLNHHS